MARRHSNAIAVAALLVLSFLATVKSQDESCPDVTACSKDADELRQKLQQKEADVTKLEELIAKLKSDLAAAESQRAATETQLSAAQADVSTAKAEASQLEQKLSSTANDLQAAQSKLTRTESDLIATKAAAEEASGVGSSCKLSLQHAESRLTEQASRLEELRAVEEALLPVWLSRRLVQAQTYTAEQWQALQDADLPGKASATAAPYVKQATAAVEPYWQQVLDATAPTRETAGVYIKQAQAALDKLPISSTVTAAKQQLVMIESELKQTLKSFVATQPALSNLGDPVTLQLLVYTIIGLPVLLVGVVLLTLLGGPRSGQSAAEHKGKLNNGGGSKKDAAATGPARATRATATRRAVKA